MGVIMMRGIGTLQPRQIYSIQSRERLGKAEEEIIVF